MSENNQPNLAGWAAILTAVAAIITAIGFPAFFPDLAKQFFGSNNPNTESIAQGDNSSNETNLESNDESEQEQKTRSLDSEKANKDVIVENVKYKLINCQQSNQIIECSLSATNQAADRETRIRADNARIIADGEQYIAESISFGSHSSFSSSARTQLVKEISINLYINFGEVSNSLSRIDLLEFTPSYSKSVQIRDIDPN